MRRKIGSKMRLRHSKFESKFNDWVKSSKLDSHLELLDLNQNAEASVVYIYSTLPILFHKKIYISNVHENIDSGKQAKKARNKKKFVS